MAPHSFDSFRQGASTLACALALLVTAGCGSGQNGSDSLSDHLATSGRPADCDDGDGGLTLPSGFCASIFADNLGHARHLVVAPSGDVYVNTSSSKSHQFTNAPGGFIVALRDADRNGRAELVERFGTTFQAGQPGGGTGMAFFDDALFVEVDDTIVRYALDRGVLVPTRPAEVVLRALPVDGDHTAHPFAITDDGGLFVNSGSASNSCQEQNRTRGSRGRQPCAELATRAGVWRYDALERDQVFSPAERFVTGARNVVAIGVDAGDNEVYVAIHGRDQLSEHWPAFFTVAQNAELPAEVFARLSKGDDYGWPYCYYDGQRGAYVLAPEYGGDGKKTDGCTDKTRPAVTFPAHWAPEALVFYDRSAFPAAYRGGAFVSFHGSWNRAPQQAGFLVAYVPFGEGQPGGPYQEFATGFAGAQAPTDPAQATHRPMGLAVGPDGALYVSDDVKGRIWRIRAIKK